jgi:hypothetical protein
MSRFTILLWVVLASSALAQQTTIAGEVIDGTKAPSEGEVVLLYFPDDSCMKAASKVSEKNLQKLSSCMQTIERVQIDREGKFTFKKVRYGRYTIVARWNTATKPHSDGVTCNWGPIFFTYVSTASTNTWAEVSVKLFVGDYYFVSFALPSELGNEGHCKKLRPEDVTQANRLTQSH